MEDEILHFQLSRASLDQLPQDERILFLAICHFANELNVLHKITVGSLRGDSTLPAAEHAKIAQSLVLFRIMAGKLREGYKVLDQFYYGTQLSRVYDSLLRDEARVALKEVRRYFKRGSTRISSIRNDFAFHYSPAVVGSALDGLSTDLSLDLYLSDHHANCLYYFAEVAVASAMLGGIDEQAMRDLADETALVARDFFRFISGYLAAFDDRHPDVMQEVASPTPPSPESLPAFEALEIPFFTKAPRRE